MAVFLPAGAVSSAGKRRQPDFDNRKYRPHSRENLARGATIAKDATRPGEGPFGDPPPAFLHAAEPFAPSRLGPHV